MTQIEIEEQKRYNSIFLNKKEVLKAVNIYFDDLHKTLVKRNDFEKNIIGDLITVIELELKKELKVLKEEMIIRVAKENETIITNVQRCPDCSSENIFSFELVHIKCRDCNSQFTN